MPIWLLKVIPLIVSVWQTLKNLEGFKQSLDALMPILKKALKNWRLILALLIGALFGFLAAWIFKPPELVASEPEILNRPLPTPYKVEVFPDLNCPYFIMKTRDDLVTNADLAISWKRRGDWIVECLNSMHYAQERIDKENEANRP